MYATTSWGYRHRHWVTGVRIAVATWNLVIGVVLVTNAYWWGFSLLAVSALVFWAAYILNPGKSGSLSNRRGQRRALPDVLAEARHER